MSNWPFRLPADWCQLQTELEADLAEVIRPELSAAGASAAYCVLVSETGWKCDGGVWGETGPRLCWWLREEIDHRWQGPGPAWMIHDVAIATEYPEWVEALSVAAAVSVHELAHRITDGLFLPEHPQRTRQCRHLYQHAVGVSAQKLDGFHKWFGHDHRWIRAALHIGARLNRLHNWLIRFEDVFDGRNHGLSPAEHYAGSLRHELWEDHDVPLTEIVATPYPQAFCDLWERDTGIVIAN